MFRHLPLGGRFLLAARRAANDSWIGLIEVCKVPIAAVPRRMIGDAASAADHVRNRRNRVNRSNVDLLS